MKSAAFLLSVSDSFRDGFSDPIAFLDGAIDLTLFSFDPAEGDSEVCC